jgi:hypothetical protein
MSADPEERLLAPHGHSAARCWQAIKPMRWRRRKSPYTKA